MSPEVNVLTVRRVLLPQKNQELVSLARKDLLVLQSLRLVLFVLLVKWHPCQGNLFVPTAFLGPMLVVQDPSLAPLVQLDQHPHLEL